MAYLEAEEKVLAEKKLASDVRNEAWLKEQRQIKEQEYNRVWKEAEKHLNDLHAQKGLAYIEVEEKSLAEKKLASDVRNEAWIKEQRQVKEQEYNRAWKEAEEDLISQIEKAKKEISNEEFSKAWVEEARLQNEIAKTERKVLEQKQIQDGLAYLEAVLHSV